jgi:hypothetical protein
LLTDFVKEMTELHKVIGIHVHSSMLGVLKELKSRVRVSRRSQDHVTVDTVVSALHHRVTSGILLVCCALVSSRQYFGDPILCMRDGLGDDTAIPTKVLNTYCFVSSSYTVVGSAGMVAPLRPFRTYKFHKPPFFTQFLFLGFLFKY